MKSIQCVTFQEVHIFLVMSERKTRSFCAAHSTTSEIAFNLLTIIVPTHLLSKVWLGLAETET